MKIFYLLILALLAGCAQQPSADDNALIITAFSTDFDTKATETSFEAGDIIGLFLEQNASNLRYETADGSSWKGFGNVGEFSSGDNVTAYYPYSESAKNQNAIEVSGGVDFMICPATPITVADNKAAANLKFKHGLSKLVVSMERPEEINGVKTVSMDSIVVKNVFRKGTINLADGKISGLTDNGDLRGKGTEIIVIPQTVQKIEIVFKMANGKFDRLAYNTPILLESGKKITINATSNADLYFTSFLDLKSGEAQSNLPLSFYVAPGRTWTLTSSETWLTFSATTGVGAATVKVSVKANSAYPLTPRTTLLTLKDDKPSSVLQKTMQNCTRIPTVEIAGTNWLTGNLTASAQGATTGFTVEPTPQGLGYFWKWGSVQAYDRSSGDTPSGHWGSSASDFTRMAATYPTMQSRDYDYANVSTTWNGATAGDPCKVLGSNYKTPTQTQIQALHDSGRLNSSYQGTPGWFFGPSAGSCSNTTLKADCIFLPMNGFRDWSNGSLSSVGSVGNYWSSSVYDANNGWHLHFYSGGNIIPANINVRSYGFFVRCVQE